MLKLISVELTDLDWLDYRYKMRVDSHMLTQALSSEQFLCT